jgi:hypothetical protein
MEDSHTHQTRRARFLQDPKKSPVANDTCKYHFLPGTAEFSQKKMSAAASAFTRRERRPGFPLSGLEGSEPFRDLVVSAGLGAPSCNEFVAGAESGRIVRRGYVFAASSS